MFPLKPFQEQAVAKLKNEFLSLWKSPHHNVPLVFKSPTGSGKTIMLAQFLRDIVSDPRFQGNDVAFLWFSFSEDSYVQSKEKLFAYYGGASELDLLDLNDLTRGRLQKNNVFFINWQKIKGKSKDSRKLRRENEWGLTFDNVINKTHEDGRKLVVIIDEEHVGADTDLALEVIDGLIRPKVTIRVSATPKYIPNAEEIADGKGGFVNVKRDEVVLAGLIKEKIIFQTEEDLNKKEFKSADQDEILLELAYRKRLDLIRWYKEIGIDINPLVLVQLPNDDQESKTNVATKRGIVSDYLKRKGVSESEIGVWLSNEKVNLENIEANESPVSFLLFKQAAATGWDCPRAGVLVMFREIKNPTFAIQTVGRILRMPLGSHFPRPELNVGYLYTNYKRNEVLAEYAKSKSDNRPAINGSYRKADVKSITLDSVFMSRTDYNDLGDTFQAIFGTAADGHFGISDKDGKQTALDKLAKKGFDTSPKVTNGLIVGVEIDDYDNFIQELVAEGASHDQEMSEYDLERLYNLLCFKLIAKQTDEQKKFAPERSWGKLKTALNVWMIGRTREFRRAAYRMIVNDLLNPASVLAPLIGSSLALYRPLREQEVNRRSERSKRTETIDLPREALFFTDQYTEMKVKKCAMSPFYIEKDYQGEDNEKGFIAFLESHKNVLWWHKNGDIGSEHFSISYYNPDENKERLFYPDWIVKTPAAVWIIDTKQGATAELADTKHKAEALQAWLKSRKGFAGGIAVQDGPNGWKLNRNSKYSYAPSFTGWEAFNDLL
ncbi:MAG: DEAD/DEAH box helicase family protein [Patescibacteria group bacterium]|nr:MAG: DEAD/DEAH box helicase family protein [Patescibacteria group bacterium]